MVSLEKAIWENLFDYSLKYARMPGVTCYDQPDLKWVFTGRPFGLNRIFCVRFSKEEAAPRVAQITAMVKSWQLPALWPIDPDSTPANLSALGEEQGWRKYSPWIGMALEMKGPIAAGPLSEGLTIASVTDEKSQEIWPLLFFSERSQEYKNHLSTFYREFWPAENHSSVCFIAYLNGEPVASSLLHLGAGVAGLYWIGTLPKARRQGIATALTRYTLQHAQSLGYHRAILQASDAGVSIYRSLGFKEYCKIELLGFEPTAL